MKVFELLKEPESWCQADYARDENGVFIDGDDPYLIANDSKAVCWCLAGAIYKCYDRIKSDEIKIMVERQIKMNTEGWNDKFERVHGNVIELCKDLAI